MKIPTRRQFIANLLSLCSLSLFGRESAARWIGESRKLARIGAARAEILRLFPKLPENELGSFLLSCTPYPCRSVPDCLPELRELAVKSAGDHNAAFCIVDAECWESMRQMAQEG